MPTVTTSNNATKQAIRNILHARGLIQIRGATTNQTFQCVADGITDDRATVLAALNAAAADMPVEVSIGPGDYGITGGMEVLLPQGSEGFLLKGVDSALTRFTFIKNAALSGGQYIALLIKPSVTPTVYDFANYIKKVRVYDIGFKDPTPYTHQSRSAEFTGTDNASVNNATTMTTAGTPFTASAMVGWHIHNTTDGSKGTITANTTNTVTVDHLFLGAANVWNSGDSFVISQTVEESHAVSIKYCTEAAVNYCDFDSIGDESINFEFVTGGNMMRNTVKNGISIGAGSALNIQHGCSGIAVSNNRLYGSLIPGTRSVVTGSAAFGVACEAGLVYDIKDITFTANHVQDFQYGYVENNAVAGAVIDGVEYIGGSIRNCATAMLYQGSNAHKNSIVDGVTVRNCGVGVRADLGATSVTNMQLKSLIITDCSSAPAVLIGGTIIKLLDLTISGVPGEAIRITSSAGVQIRGGTIDECGGSALACINSFAFGYGVSLDGMKITNSNSTTFSIANVENIANVELTQKAPTYRNVSGAHYITNLKTNGGVRFSTTAVRGKLAVSNLDCGGVDMLTDMVQLVAGNDDFEITGNFINSYNTSVDRRALSILANSDNNLVTSNNCRSRTAALGINDAGTGNTLANNKDLAGP